MIPPWLRLALVALAFTLTGRPAAARSVGGTESVSTVRIVVTGDAPTTKALGTLVAELVAELPIELEWTVSPAIDPRHVLAPQSGPRPTLVRAWVDLSDAKRAKIYVANADSERFIVRFVPEPNGYDAVAREALGQILASSIAAFLAHEDAGISREDALREVAQEAPPPVETPKPRPPSPKTPPARVELGVVYRGTVLGSGPFQHGAALVTGLSLGDSVRFASLAIVGYRAPARWEGNDIGVSVSGPELRLGAGIEAVASHRVTLGAQLGGGMDVVFVEPVDVTPTTRAHASSTDVEPILLALGIAKVRFGSALAGFIGLGCEVNLAHPRYTIVATGEATPVWTPWIVRPTLMVGLVTDFGGRERWLREKE